MPRPPQVWDPRGTPRHPCHEAQINIWDVRCVSLPQQLQHLHHLATTSAVIRQGTHHTRASAAAAPSRTLSAVCPADRLHLPRRTASHSSSLQLQPGDLSMDSQQTSLPCSTSQDQDVRAHNNTTGQHCQHGSPRGPSYHVAHHGLGISTLSLPDRTLCRAPQCKYPATA